MKKRKAYPLFPLDLDSLGSLLEIYPDSNVNDEIARYLILADEVVRSRPPEDKAERELAEWMRREEETAHIQAKGLCANTLSSNWLRMSADCHALASDWRRVGHDVADAFAEAGIEAYAKEVHSETYAVSEAIDETFRLLGLKVKQKKDREALKHGG